MSGRIKVSAIERAMTSTPTYPRRAASEAPLRRLASSYLHTWGEDCMIEVSRAPPTKLASAETRPRIGHPRADVPHCAGARFPSAQSMGTWNRKAIGVT